MENIRSGTIQYMRYGIVLTVRTTEYHTDSSVRAPDVLFIENNIDLYALQSPNLKDKLVVTVHRDDWNEAYNDVVNKLITDGKITVDDAYWDIPKLHTVLRNETTIIGMTENGNE